MPSGTSVTVEGGGATLPRSCEVRGDRQRAQPTLAMGQASSEASGGSVTLGGGARLVVEVCSPVKAVVVGSRSEKDRSGSALIRGAFSVMCNA
jgi:hypothetical protein